MMIYRKHAHIKTAALLITISLILTSCSFISGQLQDKADEDRLLKPGALDVPVSEVYERNQYKFLDKYRIEHDFLMANGCGGYRGVTVGIKDIIPGTNYAISKDLDVVEQDDHTYERPDGGVRLYNFDRYTRAEWQNGTTVNGKPNIRKGYAPVCFQSWYSTQHYLTVYLNKKNLDSPNIYGLQGGVISHELIGKNNWWVEKFKLEAPKPNGVGGLSESWVLPIADTGYVFIFELGANQDSLKYPQAHAQMQAIFRHLLESVKIEPISNDVK